MSGYKYGIVLGVLYYAVLSPRFVLIFFLILLYDRSQSYFCISTALYLGFSVLFVYSISFVIIFHFFSGTVRLVHVVICSLCLLLPIQFMPWITYSQVRVIVIFCCGLVQSNKNPTGGHGLGSGLQKNVASLLAQPWVAPFCGTCDPYVSFEGRQLLYDWL